MKKILFVSVLALNCKQDHKFLFVDESFIDTTISNFYNVGVTENVTIAYILKDKGARPTALRWQGLELLTFK